MRSLVIVLDSNDFLIENQFPTCRLYLLSNSCLQLPQQKIFTKQKAKKACWPTMISVCRKRFRIQRRRIPRKNVRDLFHSKKITKKNIFGAVFHMELLENWGAPDCIGLTGIQFLGLRGLFMSSACHITASARSDTANRFWFWRCWMSFENSKRRKCIKDAYKSKSLSFQTFKLLSLCLQNVSQQTLPFSLHLIWRFTVKVPLQKFSKEKNF